MPTSGHATIRGYDIRKERDLVRRSIGVVFLEPALDGRLTGAENLSFHAMMYGMKSKERKARMDEVLALLIGSSAVPLMISLAVCAACAVVLVLIAAWAFKTSEVV